MTTAAKKRASPRKKATRNIPATVSPLSAAWSWLRAHAMAVTIVVVALAVAGVAITVFAAQAREEQAAQQEAESFANLADALTTLKPVLENASPTGNVWIVDKYCDYGNVAIGRGDLGCVGTIKSKLKFLTPVEAEDIAMRVRAALKASHLVSSSDEFTKVRDFEHANEGGTLMANITIADVSTTGGCSLEFQVMSPNTMLARLGCDGYARKEYFPVRDY
jgi:hypothetical protein